MKTLTALFVGLLLSAMPAQAFNLVSAMELLKLENEQVVKNYALVSQVVEKIEKNQKVSEAEVKIVRGHCEDELARIGTLKLRKKIVRRWMSKIDDEILYFVHSRRDGFEDFEGRQLSARISRRLHSLLEFEAERHQRFLEVLKATP